MASCSQEPQALEKEITENWAFRQEGEPRYRDTYIPGTVHSSLLASGGIADYMYDLGEKEIQWIEKENWEYQTVFELDEDWLDKDQLMLVFEGLDTYAEIYLNNQLILQADNMFRRWEIPCKEQLVFGPNQLRVRFLSPVREGLKKLRADSLPLLVMDEQAPFNERSRVFTRKAGYHYGWEAGPRVVTSGIWKPVYLKAWNHGRIKNVHWQLKELSDSIARYTCHASLSSTRAWEAQLEVKIDSISVIKETNLPPGQAEVSIDIDLPSPKLWWPNGMGQAHLYPAEVKLKLDDQDIDIVEENIGVRRLEWIIDSDQGGEGNSFYLKVNGKPLFAKGAVYLPPHNLIPDISVQRHEQIIQSATDANMNLIRIWGGTIYESDEFYGLCDKYGLLVWQDFPFHSAMYPGDREFLENVRLEAIDNITRLRNHPSLALWCGNYDILQQWNGDDWKKSISPEDTSILWQNYQKIFHDILPEAINQLDPSRHYIASSPASEGTKVSDMLKGDLEDWKLGYERAEIEAYRETKGRFISSFGMQSYPSPTAINSLADPEDQDMNSEVMRHRQRSRLRSNYDGNDLISSYVRRYFQDPPSFQALAYLSQLTQALAIRTGIETHRRLKPYCMGSMYWHLDDCWPTISWSTLDYYGQWKAAHFAARDAFAPVAISAFVENRELNVYISSDSTQALDAQLYLKVMTFEGEVVKNDNIPVWIRSDSTQLVLQIPQRELLGYGDPRKTLVSLELASGDKIIDQYNVYFLRPRYLIFPQPDLQYKLRSSRAGNRFVVTLKTDVLAKNVYLDAGNTPGRFSDNYFDLLPGETRKIVFTTGGKNIPDFAQKLQVSNLMDYYQPQ